MTEYQPGRSSITGPREAVEAVWSHVYGKQLFRGENRQPLDRAADNPESVINRLETAMGHIWTYADEHNLKNVLEKEGAPQPSEVQAQYKPRLLETHGDETELDTDEFENICDEVYAYYEVMGDLVQERKHGA